MPLYSHAPAGSAVPFGPPESGMLRPRKSEHRPAATADDPHDAGRLHFAGVEFEVQRIAIVGTQG